MAKGMKTKKGDRVEATAGKDSGREGTVIQADPVTQRVLVQGVSVIPQCSSHNYPPRRGATPPRLVHPEAVLLVSTLPLIDPETKKAARAGYRFDGETKVRVTRPGGKDI